MKESSDNVVEVIERIYDGKRYRVTITEHRQVMPWGTEPCCFRTAQWQLLGPTQPTLFDG